MGFFVGQVMKATGGRAEPQAVAAAAAREARPARADQPGWSCLTARCPMPAPPPGAAADARPDARPPARRRRHGAAARRTTHARVQGCSVRARAAQARLPHRARRHALHGVGHRRVRVGLRQPCRPATACSCVTRGQLRRALGQDGAGVRRRGRDAALCVGRAARSRRDRRGVADATTSRWPSSCTPRPRRRPCSTCRRSPSARASAPRCSRSTPSPRLGAAPLETDAWGLDVVVTGSQKALMTAARAGLRERLAERALERSRADDQPALLLRLAAHARRAAQGAAERLHARDLADAGGLDAALDRMSRRRASRRSGSARAPWARALRARACRAWGSSCSRPTTTTARS